jgi:uncharacterized protein YkwD
LVATMYALSAIPSLYHYPSGKSEAIQALAYVNELRQQYGRSPLQWDDRVYALAMARAKDMNAYHYYDHTNPVTGACPFNMKGQYGLTDSEFATENISGYETKPMFYRVQQRFVKDAVDDWLYSRGHRFNLLYKEHTAGAIACDKDKCVFLGVNRHHYGADCTIAAEGRRVWKDALLQPDEVTLQPKPD